MKRRRISFLLLQEREWKTNLFQSGEEVAPLLGLGLFNRSALLSKLLSHDLCLKRESVLICALKQMCVTLVRWKTAFWKAHHQISNNSYTVVKSSCANSLRDSFKCWMRANTVSNSSTLRVRYATNNSVIISPTSSSSCSVVATISLTMR